MGTWLAEGEKGKSAGAADRLLGLSGCFETEAAGYCSTVVALNVGVWHATCRCGALSGTAQLRLQVSFTSATLLSVGGVAGWAATFPFPSSRARMVWFTLLPCLHRTWQAGSVQLLT